MVPKLRFAPSPTGFLHVGGARTAIFNWLIARKTGGSFLLRIEDTDRSRSTEQAKEQILSSLKWIGLDWDGEIYYQSRHEQRHREVANRLVESGKAYRCFCSRDEIEQKRLVAEKNKINQRYDGTCRNLSTLEIERNLETDKPFAIRFMVEPGEVEYDDLIHGKTVIQNDTLDDFIIVRSDGSPTYQLSVVTDDHDMGITQVLRGDDHIANTNKQILIYQALDWLIPDFGHLPLILGLDKKRFSKRHGAASVEEYWDQGILPQALFNYLCLLGWSPGDDKEIMSIEELIAIFDINRVNPSAAVFDPAKLFWMNGKYIAALPEDFIWETVQKWLQENNHHLHNEENQRFRLLAKLQQSRSKNLQDFTNGLEVFFELPEEYDPKGVNKHFLTDNAVSILQDIRKLLHAENESVFRDVDKIEKLIRELADKMALSTSKLIHPLRMALTGSTASPGIFEMIHILGKDKVDGRINKALEYINSLPG